MCWRDRAAPAGHCHSNGVGWDGMRGGTATPWHTLGTSVAAPGARRGCGSEVPAAASVAHGRLGTAECGPTGLCRSPSRSAGFLERLEPAPASRGELRAPSTAPGHGPSPRGRHSLQGLLCALCQLPAPWKLGKSSPFPPGGFLQSGSPCPRRWRRTGDQEDTWRCQWGCRGALDGKGNAGHL